MDVKELSEWIFDMWHEWEGIYGISGEQNLKDSKKKDEVIERLKRGEKYEAIVSKIDDVINSHGAISKESVIRIEQKYFPKPVKDKDYFYEATSKDPHLKKIKFKVR